MDNEIEAIAKKYKLDSVDSDRKNHHSFDITPIHKFNYTEKVKLLELENEKLKKKYSQALAKVKSLSKELEKQKANDSSTKISNKTYLDESWNKAAQFQESELKLKFYEQQIEFLLEDNKKTCLIYNQEIENLKKQLEASKINSIYQMKELIAKQAQEINILKNNSKLTENINEMLNERLEKSQFQHEETETKINKLLYVAEEKYEKNKNNNAALIDENNYLKARLKNIQYELESCKSKLKQKDEEISKLLG